MIRSSHYYPWPASSHWSEICDACRPESPEHPRALRALCETFVGPVYSYIRRSVPSTDEAKDLTQDFFAFLLGESQPLKTYDRERGRFRPFLRAVLGNFLKNRRRDAGARKRLGGGVVLSVDWSALERLCPGSDDAAPDVEFERNYARVVLERCLAAVREEFARSRGGVRAEALLSRLIDGKTSTYEEMAAEFGVSPGSLRTTASRLLAQLRTRIYQEVARTVPAGADVDDEIRHLYQSFFSRPSGPPG
jgi:RNA polymerase sigma-70 factor (ECF subfamily)